MRILIIILSMVMTSAQAADHVWYGVGSACGDLLLTCVTGANDGDTVIIKTNEIIEEALITDASVSLIAADGYSPVFGLGHDISLANRNTSLRIEGLTLLDGGIRVDNRATTLENVHIEIKNNNITKTSSQGILVRQWAIDKSLKLDIKFNQIDISGDRSTAIALSVPAAGDYSWDALVYGNNIEISEGSWGVLAYNGSGFGDLHNVIAANVIKGAGRSGIEIQNNFDSEARVTSYVFNNFIRGTKIIVSSKVITNGETNAFLYNNTLVDTPTGITLAGADGATPLYFHLVNNLIINAEIGIDVGFPSYNVMLTNETNMFQKVGGHNNYTVTGSNIPVADHVQIVKSGMTPRLADGSLAIDAGTFVAMEPFVDADGLYRSKLGGIDIGAFEYGDVTFIHSASGGAYTSQISNPATNGEMTSESIHITQNATQPVGEPSLYNLAHAGIWYSLGLNAWNIFNQDLTTEIEHGVKFNVIKIGDSVNTYEHQAGADLTPFTLLDNPALNNEPGKILQVTQHWTSVYNNHPTGIYYNGLTNKWSIYNLDLASMPDGANFNVQYQDASKSAWVHTVTSDNSTTLKTVLNNPWINGVECAQIQVTQKAVSGAFNADPITVAFDRSINRWTIRKQRENGGITAVTPIPTGAQFHILINPQQIEQCHDMIFDNGFD